MQKNDKKDITIGDFEKTSSEVVESTLVETSRREQPKKVKRQTLHSIKELAEFLGCSVVTAQKLKNSGEIRYRQFGKKVIFFCDEIMQDLEKGGKGV